MVTRIDNNEEICLDMYRKDTPPGTVSNTGSGFTVEFVWKSTTFIRMKNGLKRFWRDEESISSYLYYSLLGQEREAPVFDIDIPKTISAPNLPELNVYQV
jgi:regulator of nonsense transcripts 1